MNRWNDARKACWLAHLSISRTHARPDNHVTFLSCSPVVHVCNSSHHTSAKQSRIPIHDFGSLGMQRRCAVVAGTKRSAIAARFCVMWPREIDCLRASLAWVGGSLPRGKHYDCIWQAASERCHVVSQLLAHSQSREVELLC
jgi:hypothetical protein